MPITDRIRKVINDIANKGKNAINDPEIDASRKARVRTNRADPIDSEGLDRIRSIPAGSYANRLGDHLTGIRRKAAVVAFGAGIYEMFTNALSSSNQVRINVPVTNKLDGRQFTMELSISKKQRRILDQNPDYIKDLLSAPQYHNEVLDVEVDTFLDVDLDGI